MTEAFLKWWLTFIIQLATVSVAIYFGYFEYVKDNDITYLSFLILVLWVITSIFIGKYIYNRKQIFEVQWFVAETCMTVGMIGTVIGFLLMLNQSFTDIDVENIDSMRNTISTMASGLSVALLTTLNGLVASLFLKLQIIIGEHTDEA